MPDANHTVGSAGGNQFPADLQPNTAAAILFLKGWCPAGPWVLTAIHPDRPGTITRTFAGKKREAEACDFINRHRGEWNIYFTVNSLKAAVSKKAEKADVASMDWLHIDVDPRAREDLAEERQRIRALLEGYAPKPTVVIDSGGGFQAFWKLAEPLRVDGDPAKIAEAERFTRQLARVLGGDDCWNIDRIMRLPGTINVPNEKKRKAGRTKALAQMVSWDWERTYPITSFEPAALPRPTSNAPGVALSPNRRRLESVDDLPPSVSQRIKMVIVRGDDPDDPYPSRSHALFAVVCELVREGCSDDAIAAVIMDPDFGISASVLDKRRPEEYATRQIAQARLETTEPEVADLNRHHAVVLTGGKAAVLAETENAVPGAKPFELLSVSAFETWMRNKGCVTRTIDNKIVQVPLSKYWLGHPMRREYSGIAFQPGREVEGYYNLWTGFAVQPGPGDCSKFLGHVRDNICRGSEDHFRWVVGWMAHIVQHPGGERPGTSLVLRGKMGTGKTIIFKTLKSLLGSHALIVSEPRYITGKFNAHMSALLLLCADESFWAGDKAAEGKLRNLVTGDTHQVEFKNFDAVTVPNFIRLGVCGNNDWQVPAGMEERRFAVFDVSDEHMQDRPYFAAIEAEMAAGGREALLHHLLNFDLETVDLREIPKTEALLEQKIASLPPERAWWLDLLRRGRLPGDESGTGLCPSEFLYDDYIRHAKKIGVSRRSIETQIGMFLGKMVPERRVHDRNYNVYTALGERRAKAGTIYEFPPLKECRALFEKAVGQKIKWRDERGVGQQHELGAAQAEAEERWKPAPLDPSLVEGD